MPGLPHPPGSSWPAPASRSAKASWVWLSGTMRVMRRSAGITPSATSSTAVSKSCRWYTRAPRMLSSRQNTRCRSISRGVGWIATDHDRAAHLGEPRRAEHGRCGPRDLEDDVRTGAGRPLGHPRHLIDRAGVERREVRVPRSARAASRRVRSRRRRRRSGGRRIAISTPIGPPPMTTTFCPGVSCERRTSWTATATGSTRAA